MRFVRSSKKPKWGLGVVTGNGDAAKLRILFENAGYKALSPEGLVESPDAEVPADHPLRNPDEWSRIELDVKRAESLLELGTPLKFDRFIQTFRAEYPDGLRSPACESRERTPKLEASRRFKEDLPPHLLEGLLERGDHAGLLERLRTCLAPLSLEFTLDLAVLANIPPSATKEIAEKLVLLLQAGEPTPEALEALTSALLPHGAAKWPLLSILPFLANPERWPFVKPFAIERLQQTTCISVEYDARPNARSYRRICEFYARVFEILTERGFLPRDVVDVQIFFDVASGVKGTASARRK